MAGLLLEVLIFSPHRDSADPFSGIIAFGKGKAPGGPRNSFDATVYI